MPVPHAAIEPLEARIAPATIFVTDVDGDLVTITTSKGTIDQLRAAIQPHIEAAGDPQIGGFLIHNIVLSSNAVFSGTDLTITATPQKLDPDGDGRSAFYGDGLVNIGMIDGSTTFGTVNLDLGKITVDGDLSVVRAGTGSATIPAVKSLNVGSIGEGDVVASYTWNIQGSLGALTVKGNVVYAAIYVENGNLGPVKIGGSLVGTGDSSGLIDVSGNIGPVDIKGDIVGSQGHGSSHGGNSGRIHAGGNIASILIGGSLRATDKEETGHIDADGSIGNVTIKGDVIGGPGTDSGNITANFKIGNVTIGGSLIGGTGARSGAIIVEHASGTLGAVKVGGDVRINTSANAAIMATTSIVSLTVGGSVVGAAEGMDGIDSSEGKIGAIKIGRDLLRAELRAETAMGAVTIGGSVNGGQIFVGTELGTLGAVKIAGDLVGGAASNSGSVFAGILSSVTVGGSIIGGAGSGSGSIYAENQLGTVSVAGSLIGGNSGFAGSIYSEGSITSVTVKGSVEGGDDRSQTGYIGALARIGTATIGGSLIGGDNLDSGTIVIDTGSIRAARLGSVTIGGSVLAGVLYTGANPGEVLQRSGSIVASEDIGTVKIKGSLVGTYYRPATILAGGLAGNPINNNMAIKSVTIDGHVDHAWIFAGVGLDGSTANGNAQIGSVTVGGDWLGSTLAAGVNPVDGAIGDGNDTIVAGGTMSKIASITIKGKVLGGNGDIFGFAARHIGSFKYSGQTVALTAGAGNDTFTAGKAIVVGPSLADPTASKPDPYAVHVYEV